MEPNYCYYYLYVVWFQLMACEKKFRQEIDELKAQIKRMQENERKEKRKLAEEDAIKKISKMEEKISELSKNLATQKQVYLWKLYVP